MTDVTKIRVAWFPEIRYYYVIHLKNGKALVGCDYRSRKAALRAGQTALYAYKETATND